MQHESSRHDSLEQSSANSASGETPVKTWGIVGGGILGLTLALRLVQRGQKVTVIEGASSLGGLASPWQLGDVTWDRFYHVILLSDTKLRAVLEQLDLEKDIHWVQTKTGFYSGGKLHSLSSSLEFLRFPPLNLLEKFRLGGTIFFGSKIRNWKAMEKLTVAQWLRRWSGESVFKKIWEPLLRCKLGEAYTRTSAAFIWSYIARMYAARRTGLKKEMFGYVPGGYARVLVQYQQKLEQLGVKFQVGKRVESVEQKAGEGTIRFTDQSVQQFDNVLLTIPSPQIANITPQLDPDQASRHSQIEYLGVVCTSLLLKQPLSEYYVTNITDSWVTLTGVIEMGTIVDRSETGGCSLVYLPKYMLSDDPAMQESDSTIEERCLATLERMYPHFHRDQVVAMKTARAKYVMSLPTLGYSERLPPVVSNLPGIYALNSAQIVKGNLNVNETIAIGDELLDREVWPDFLARCKKM